MSRGQATLMSSYMSWSSESVCEPEEYHIMKETYELRISTQLAETRNDKTKELVESIMIPSLHNLEILKKLEQVENLPPETL